MSSQKRFGLLLVILLFLSLYLWTAPSRAQTITTHSDLELANKFSPILYFHPDEIFFPQPIDVLLSQARLRQDISLWFDLNILDTVTLNDLFSYRDANVFLDIWYGSAGDSDAMNYSAHRKYYIENLSPENGGLSPATYAKVIHDSQNEKIIIQYWLFYYYNDWFNKHEGDWEIVQIILDQNESPEWVIYSQHHGGTRRPWQEVQTEDQTHPLVFVALGSHANYFWGNEIYPNGKDIGNTRVEILDRTGYTKRTLPEVVLLGNTWDVSPIIENSIDSGWLFFGGRWGEAGLQADFGGPYGPTSKELIWDAPFTWGVSQNLDSDTWYQNRLIIKATSNIEPTILNYENFNPASFDIGKNYIIYHEDLPQNESLELMLNLTDPKSMLTLSIPNQLEGIVKLYNYNIENPDPEKVKITFNSSGEHEISLNKREIQATSQHAKSGTWESPDLIWFAGYLPLSQVLKGIFISLVAGIFPGLIYIYIVYRVDYFEREPLTLLLATFLWGAIPSVIISITIPLFFELPPELLGPGIIEAVQAGLYAPLIEEAIKGVIILFISIRFSDEFDDTLDGIIYGAFVGLGFAITGNTISYLGSFIVRGFNSLGTTVFVEGLLFGLNHAMYSAIFGAGLGYAKFLRDRKKKWLVSISAFFLAVLANGLHSFMLNSFEKLSIWAILISWAGLTCIVLIMIWSLNRQKQIILRELKNEIPFQCLAIIISRKNQRQALRMAAKQNGKPARKNLDLQFQLLTELAFKLHQSKFKQNRFSADTIQTLRNKITDLNQMTNFL